MPPANAALSHPPPTTRESELARLRQLLPLRHLTDAEFAALAAHVEIEHCEAGHGLFRSPKDDGWLFYLLDGEVVVVDADEDEFAIRAGSVEALHPLTPHAAARVAARAASPLRYVRLPAKLLGRNAPQPRAGIQLEEITAHDDGIDHQLLFAVYHTLQEGRLELPTLPDVALKIRAAVADPRKGAYEVAQIITLDPALASYCIRVANSAAYGSREPVAGVHEAVARMGLVSTRDFALAYSVRNLFQSRNPRCLALMKGAWAHNANIAALCHVIARRVGRINPEQALLAGLLHDIGVMVLISHLADFPSAFDQGPTLGTALRELKHQVGAMVMRAWELPETMVAACFAAEDWKREPPPQLNLADVVLLAHWHQEPPHVLWADPVPTDGVPLLSRLPADWLAGNGRLQVVQEAAGDLGRMRALLGS
jgi:HD-like signal output (HDOD) protein